MRALFRAVVALLFTAALLAGLAVLLVLHALRTPLALEQESLLRVERGTTMTAVLDQLEDEQRLRPEGIRPLLQLGLRLAPQWAQIQAGPYWLRPGDTLRDLAERLRRGDSASVRITVIEGQTFAEMRRQLEAHEGLSDNSSDLDAAELMAAIGRPGLPPEGRFLPETYELGLGSTTLAAFGRLADALDRELARAWADRDPALTLKDPGELLTLASIIEKETALESERGQIAGVFHRRLLKGMRLQTDPTVIYGLGEAFDGDLRRADLRRDTPYNTDTRAGLPPTPICLPGAAALQAAGRPEPGDSLYFVATGDGAHVFSATLEEHEAAVRCYQLGRC